jgi:hypothetical protein
MFQDAQPEMERRGDQNDLDSNCVGRPTLQQSHASHDSTARAAAPRSTASMALPERSQRHRLARTVSINERSRASGSKHVIIALVVRAART